MRHRQKSERFSRPEGQRRALKRSLLRALLTRESITVLKSQARYLGAWMDNLITLAKTNDLHHRRLAYQQLNDHALVKHLFDDLVGRFKDVNSGFTRHFSVGLRKGDGADLVLIQLTRLKEKKEKTPKGKDAKGETKSETKGASAQDAGKDSVKAPAKGIKKLFRKDRTK